MYMIQS